MVHRLAPRLYVPHNDLVAGVEAVTPEDAALNERPLTLSGLLTVKGAVDEMQAALRAALHGDNRVTQEGHGVLSNERPVNVINVKDPEAH